MITDKTQQVLKRDIVVADTTGIPFSPTDSPLVTINEALAAAQSGHPQTGDFAGRPMKWWPFMYDDATIAIFGLPLDHGPITQEAIALLQGLAEVIIYQHALLDKMQSSERLQARFLQETLTNPSQDTTEAYHQADILKLDLKSPASVILIEIEGFAHSILSDNQRLSTEESSLKLSEAASAACKHLSASFPPQPHNTVCHLQQDQFVVVKGVIATQPTTLNTIKYLKDQSELIRHTASSYWPSKNITIGVGQYYPELAGLRKSFEDAKLALSVGQRIWGHNRVYHIKDVGMYITLSATTPERKAELAHQILAPLMRDEQLFKTVSSFLSKGLNLTDAAEDLHIHRNTLIYRLDKTEKLIGLDPRHFDDALQIKLGLMFYSEPTT
ncbi:helix-turn-helix domain-containing protein [bacterium]|nr:MAG: helix-turn-helix domain-containing protein [bacterium]